MKGATEQLGVAISLNSGQEVDWNVCLLYLDREIYRQAKVV